MPLVTALPCRFTGPNPDLWSAALDRMLPVEAVYSTSAAEFRDGLCPAGKRLYTGWKMIWAGVFHLQLLWWIESFSLMPAKCTFNWIGERVGWAKRGSPALSHTNSLMNFFLLQSLLFCIYFPQAFEWTKLMEKQFHALMQKSYRKSFLHIQIVVLLIRGQQRHVPDKLHGQTLGVWSTSEYQTQE